MGCRTLLVTGGLGTGKTSVAVEIGFVLEEAGLPNAVIDVDWLGWVGPGVSATEHRSLLEDNLAAVTGRMRDAGIERFVLARPLTGPDDLEWMVSAVPDHEVTAVALDVDLEVARERVRLRDVGATTEHDLAQVDELADAAAFVALRVPNQDRPVRETALDVLRAAGWQIAGETT